MICLRGGVIRASEAVEKGRFLVEENPRRIGFRAERAALSGRETTGAEQFAALVAKLKELGVPVEWPPNGP